MNLVLGGKYHTHHFSNSGYCVPTFICSAHYLQTLASFTHNTFFKSKRGARQSSKDSSVGIFGSQSQAERFLLSPIQGCFGLTAFSITDTLIGDRCQKSQTCNPGLSYRSYDRSCNNLANPVWGKSGSPFQRTLLPEYVMVYQAKKWQNLALLFHPPDLSINIIPDVDAPSERDTHIEMQ